MTLPEMRESLHAGHRIVKEVTIPAPPERVYEAWAEPDLIAGWFVERAVGRAEEGGRVIWHWDAFGAKEEHEVLTALPGRRLVLSSRAGDGGLQIVEVTLSPESGGTRLRLVHSGFVAGAGDPTYDGTDAGWTIALELLRYWTRHHFGRSKTELLILRRVPGSCGRARELFESAEGRARWLTAPPGASLEGVTLSQAGPELARTWLEGDGTLELKAFAYTPDECHVGVRVVSWGADRAALGALRPHFERAVDRLAALLT